MPMTASPEATTSGTIYDIGYRHYDGPRLGRRGAITAVIGAGLRAVFGLGRGGRSKIIPWGAVILAALPAFVAIAVRVLAGEILEVATYEGYLWSIGGLMPIFVAAQAPELVVNDIRHRVLPLYFSRPMGRLDYVAAKLLALALALLTITLLPVFVLFVGRVLAAEDVVGAIGDEAGSLPAILGSGVLHAVVLASIGLAISSLAGRRAYAAGAVLAIFLIGGVVGQILTQVGGSLAVAAPFTDILAILDGTRQWLFGGSVPESPVGNSDAPLPLYGLATAVLTAVSLAILAIRYRRITT
jgi:ABC-2 type transport system permease protein